MPARYLSALLCSLAAAAPAVRAAGPQAPAAADVVVYGGTPAGVAAAAAAADDGRTVVLVEPTARVGGMLMSGLSHADFRTFEGLTGAYLDITRRVQAHYRTAYGPDSPQAKGTFRGTHAEPKVNLAVLDALLAERPRVTVLRSHALAAVRARPDGDGRRVEAVDLAGPAGARVEVAGRVFIDAGYEGDLMAAAKAAYRVGREGKAEYEESLAPDEADGQVQAYNFRLVATTDPANRAAVAMPAGYRREDYAGVVPLLEAGKFAKVFGTLGEAVIYKAQEPPLPNNKYDINDVSRGLVRLSLPGENLAWPDGDAAARTAVFDAHVRWNAGLLYYLQTDDAVPAKFRDEARRWGWCRDEFADTGHLPPQLYVREARRMRGAYVFTQRDVAAAPGDARSVLRADAVAVGDYGANCHGTAHEGPRAGGKHTGEFYLGVAPYQVPYGVLVPKDVSNLLVPGAVSASHVGFCCLRYEPIWAALGQAAGHAAHLALDGGGAVGAVSPAAVQARLHRAGAATVYVSDVPPGSPDFAAVQWWGTAGGLHGLHPAPGKPGQRGKNILGQYFEAYPGHAAELAERLTPELAGRWGKLAAVLGVKADGLPAADGTVTRGDWVRAAYARRTPR